MPNNQPRKTNGLWWGLGIAAVVLGAGAFAALVPLGDDERAAAKEEPPPPNRSERLGAAIDLLRQGRPPAQKEEEQGIPAALPKATEQDLLQALFDGDDAPARLGLVLTAIEANPTPPEADPLWSRTVDGISSLW